MIDLPRHHPDFDLALELACLLPPDGRAGTALYDLMEDLALDNQRAVRALLAELQRREPLLQFDIRRGGGDQGLVLHVHPASAPALLRLAQAYADKMCRESRNPNDEIRMTNTPGTPAV